MEISQAIAISGFTVWAYMSVLFIIALILKDNSIADIGWGMGFIIVTLTIFLLAPEFSARQILITILVLIWGIRLSTRILRRNWGKGEDYRYQKWRKEWGKNFVLRSYLQVFLLQGFFMWLITLPVVITNAKAAAGLNWVDYTGIFLWLAGFSFEAVGDWQLDRFLSTSANRGKILDSGLWRYSRHPNYFGEITMWWAIYIISLSQPWGWATIIGPLTITFLIIFVSGIPMLERSMMKNPDYRRYAARTSILVPLPTKSSTSTNP